MALVTVQLTSSSLAKVLDKKTAFTLSRSQTVKQVHTLDKRQNSGRQDANYRCSDEHAPLLED